MLSRTLLSPTLALQASVRRSQTCCPLLWPSSLAPAPPLVFPSWGVQCWWSPLQADPKSTQEQSRSEPREAPCCARVTSLPPSLGWKWEAVSRAGSSQNTGCAVGPEGSKQENAIEEAHVSVVCVSAKVQSRRRLQRTTEKFQRCYLPPQNKISPEGKKKKKLFTSWGQPAQWLEHTNAGVSRWPGYICHLRRSTKLLNALLWPQTLAPLSSPDECDAAGGARSCVAIRAGR